MASSRDKNKYEGVNALQLNYCTVKPQTDESSHKHNLTDEDADLWGVITV